MTLVSFVVEQHKLRVMNTRVIKFVVCLVLTYSACLSALDVSNYATYKVGRRVGQFSSGECYTSPEAAYATMERLRSRGDRRYLAKVGVPRVARLYPERLYHGQTQGPREPQRLRIRLLEVLRLGKHSALVLARQPGNGDTPLIYCMLEYEQGRWLYAGQAQVADRDSAVERFARHCSQLLGLPKPRVYSSPNVHLENYTRYLREEGRDPHGFVLETLNKHRLVVIGEIHHREQYWRFHSELVRDPMFAGRVGTIYLELPAHGQAKVDGFLAANICDPNQVIEVLRDMMWLGWPDKTLLDFFILVWQVNQSLAPEKRIAIVLADMARPWDRISDIEEMLEIDRDRVMAETILAHMDRVEDGRHGLFITGLAHAAKGLTYVGEVPVRTAGWYLKQALGEELYCITQHACRITNKGKVEGRIGLGIFDEAFAINGNRSVAFSLAEGPFGDQPYDASPDRPVHCSFRDAFDAYLFLGFLDTERFSDLIDGFYTNEHLAEMARRHQVLFKREWRWAQALGAEPYTRHLSKIWGQPRNWKSALGPIGAWRLGNTKVVVNEVRAALE